MILLGAAILFTGGIYSCQKETNNMSPNSLDASNVGKKATIITFNEPDEIAVNTALANALGYTTLILKSGDHNIKFDENLFGRTAFTIDSGKSRMANRKGTNLNTNNGSIGVRIRIAKIHQKNRTCECCGGAGFNCGFINALYDSPMEQSVFNDIPHDDRTVYGTMTVNNSSTLTIDFLSEINWDNLAE